MTGPKDHSAAAASHADLMDQVYRGQKYIYDLTRKYYLLGRDQLIDGLAPPAGGSVLELGCGTGRNLVLAAKRWPNAHFVGLDISDEMLSMAQKQVHKHGLTHRIQLVQGDATNPALGALLPEHGFDRVFISFSLSMIPDWQQVLAAAKTVLARSGEIHIVDFGDCQDLPSGFAALLSAWLARFHVSIRSDLPNIVAQQDELPDWSAHGRHLFRRYSYYGVIARRH